MIVAATTAVAASPAAAFPTAGPRNDVAARQAMQDYADCLVDRSPVMATRLLALDPGGRGMQAAFSDYARSQRSCLHNGTTLSMNAGLLAGVMAEQMLERRPDRAELPRALRYDPSQPPIVARSPIEAIGLCVVRRAPDQAMRLLATKPASAEEQTAITALVPTLQGCVPAGQNVAMSPVAFRSDVAHGAYMIVSQNDRTADAVARK